MRIWILAALAAAFAVQGMALAQDAPLSDARKLAPKRATDLPDPGRRIAAAMQSGDDVVKAMHAKYRNAWFATTRFAQKTTTYDASGTPSVESWYERIQLPGKLRIDVGPTKDGNATIFTDGQMHSFKNGVRTGTQPFVSMALVLAFDVYRQAPEVTIAQLKQEGVDTTKVHEDLWEGRPAFAIGADRGDLTTKQVWIDKERLVVVRMILPSLRAPGEPSDVRFLDFRAVPRGWIAARIDVYRKDRLVMSEEYSDIETDTSFDPAWFDPSTLTTPTER